MLIFNDTSRATPGASRPSLIALRLSDVEFDSSASFCTLLARLGHISQSIPAITLQALEVLELAQPLLVVPLKKGDKQRYRLVGGYRTYQLLSEQFPRSRKSWAILLPGLDAATEATLAAFDAVVSKLLQRPDGKDLAVIAATLQRDEKLRRDASLLIPVGTDNELAAALGMSRTTLYRQTEAVKTALAQFVERHETNSTVDVDISPDNDEEE